MLCFVSEAWFLAVITISQLSLDSWMVNPCLYEKHEILIGLKWIGTTCS